MDHLPDTGHVAVFDLEFTSWPGFQQSNFRAPGKYPEVIQMGAVLLDAGNSFVEIDAFERYVKPTINAELSDYIIDLTGITQAQIEADGIPFADALSDLADFVGPAEILMSYGNDGDVLKLNHDLYGLTNFPALPDEVDLRQFFVRQGLVERHLVSSDLPGVFGLSLDVAVHTGLGDARALGCVLQHLRKARKV